MKLWELAIVMVLCTMGVFFGCGIGAEADYHAGWEEGYYEGFYDGYDSGYGDAINDTLEIIDRPTEAIK